MFTLTDEQEEKLADWIKDLKDLGSFQGAIGGRLTYEFTPTSLGMIVKVKDSMYHNEIDLSDYQDW